MRKLTKVIDNIKCLSIIDDFGVDFRAIATSMKEVSKYPIYLSIEGNGEIILYEDPGYPRLDAVLIEAMI